MARLTTFVENAGLQSFCLKPEGDRRIEDVQALQEWLASGTVSKVYLDSVLGDPEDGIQVGPVINVPWSAFQKLNELSRLEYDWDSYGGTPPAESALDGARALLKSLGVRLCNLPAERLAPFAIAPLRDGGVQLEWRTQAGLVEIECRARDSFGYLRIQGSPGGQSSEEGDGIALTEAVSKIETLLEQDVE